MHPTNDDSGGDDLRPLDAALRANRDSREARYRMTNADIHYCANAIAAHHGLDPAVIVNGLANSSVGLLAKLDTPNAVVSKVGNVRVDKLETPQDIGQALKIADNVAGGFDAARRGKISFAETQALAQDLGMTADDLLARRKGQAFSAEEA